MDKVPPPASETDIDALTTTCGFALPPEYLAFLRISNGGEGFLCIEPWYFRLWPANEVIEMNTGYCVEKYCPRYFGIGSSGGGEMLAIRKRDGSPCPIYMVPFIGLDEDEAVQIAHDFEMFAMCLGREASS